MWSLTESLVELLQDSDSDMTRMTILLLRYLLLDNGAPIATPIALQLAEALLPLFDHDDIQVQLSCMCVFQELLDLVTQDGRKALKAHMRQSLVPLYFHCHDENQIVAEASLEMLLCVAEFLKRRDLDKLVKKKKLCMFADSLLAEDRSRAAEHLRRALPYLQSPQEPLREAAVRIIGMAGRHLRGQQPELQLICTALEEMANDISLSVRSLALQNLHILRAEATIRYSILENLEDRLRRAWKTGLRVTGLGRLCCLSSMER